MDKCDVCAWAQGIMGSVRVEAVASYLGEGEMWLCDGHLQFLLEKGAKAQEMYASAWRDEIELTKAASQAMRVTA